MRLSDGLKAKRGELLDRLEVMSKAASDERRELNATETAAWDAGIAEARDLEQRIERQLAAEALARGDRGDVQPIGEAPRFIDEAGNPVRTLGIADKLADALPRRAANEPAVGLGRFVRAAATGNWRGIQHPVERAIGIGGDQVFPVPTPLSTTWWDNVRAASVCMRAGARTAPMTSDTLKMIRVDGDPTVTWRKEHRPIPESDPLFGSVTLNAKLGGIICRLSVEVIEDSNPAAEGVIESIMTSAMALAVDYAMLAGDGSQVGDLDNPLGLLHDPAILTEAAVDPMVNYDPQIDAMAQVMANNITPNAFIANPAFIASAAKTRTGLAGDQTTLVVPEPFLSLPKLYTTSMPVGTSVVGDFGFLLLGLRTNMVLEATRTGGDGTFSKAQYLVRLYTRIDTARVRSKAFCKIA